ncbi:MAG: elongation factor P maturation arginine rhamnosyltransferase EarP [Sulfuricella sp.]|nr:elongation factor P maturation arginine rhamnosyltransferase EarP [Sulfuricella sp.]
MGSHATWDIFCTVVDNYGDIGVCWRLARQLAAEHGLTVRLWADDLPSFHRICPEADPRLPIQTLRSVEIRQWSEANLSVVPADVVIEAFACDMPETYLATMATSGRKHAWVNLEYLSAETWIDSHHGLPSPHPRLPLIKYFFFPGFSEDSGGLLAETGLAGRRLRFQAQPALREAFWRSLDMPAPGAEELRISLFCYADNAAQALFSFWSEGTMPVLCVVPEGVAAAQISEFFRRPYSGAGNHFGKKNLIVRVLPFLEQDAYDRLLWACDFNFVRGEDSFLRAQWAARPMVWQIYPQREEAHRPKLRAFLSRYCADLAPAAAADLDAFTDSWNRGGAVRPDWDGLWRHRPVLDQHAREWANTLMKKEDLATKLVNFCNNKLQ